MSMRLIIVSGLSGSGKSVALHMLEDIDFYCVDNIPAALLKSFISHTVRGMGDVDPRTAVGLDARNRPSEIETIPGLADELRRSGIDCEVLYLHASDEVLLKRFAETRRKHPLVHGDVSLREAIASERKLLEPITAAADWVIDTSHMGVHALRELIVKRIDRRREGRLSLMFESFGYKHGIPGDADFVFDVRSLPNPYWQLGLRELTGRGRRISLLPRRRAQHDRRPDRISGAARAGILAGQPQLSDHSGRLHRRPASLRLHRRTTRRAFPQLAPAGAHASRRLAETDLNLRACVTCRKSRISAARACASLYPSSIISRVKPRSNNR
jgi:UPF0042 nucleotide-binding protein